jgi:hypothetical protein
MLSSLLNTLFLGGLVVTTLPLDPRFASLVLAEVVLPSERKSHVIYLWHINELSLLIRVERQN